MFKPTNQIWKWAVVITAVLLLAVASNRVGSLCLTENDRRSIETMLDGATP